MYLDCLKDVISDNLILEIDLNDINSWDLNSGLTVSSIVKWKDSVNNKDLLLDYGLTAFDNGGTNNMLDQLQLTSKYDYLKLQPVRYNTVTNPSNIEYTGSTILSSNTNYEITPITTGSTGNYFNLDGGFLQGFFKLHEFNYMVLPDRYGNGITIETIINIDDDSSGIFYYMGTRAEDKYNPSFTGETNVKTKNDKPLTSIKSEVEYMKAFRNFEDKTKTKYTEYYPTDSLKNNVICFEITEDKRLGYKYIDENGFVVYNASHYKIPYTGFTSISVVFKPYGEIKSKICDEKRLGKIYFYVNGRVKWTVDRFPEFYFREINNDSDKQIGVPYNIGWGGGSFGLKHSWHYDYQDYIVYRNNDLMYINNNFIITNNPITTNNNVIDGLELSENNNFKDENNNFISVIGVTYTGSTETNYLINFTNPITVLPNRPYIFKAEIYDQDLFEISSNNKISIITYNINNEQINVLEEIIYKYPYNSNGGWYEIKSINNIINTNNYGEQIKIGLLIESSNPLNLGGKLFIKNIDYNAPDILVKDINKNNLIIEENFTNSFKGGIQKLRIYDNALTSEEVLHNSLIDNKQNPNIIVNKGGRLIKR